MSKETKNSEFDNFINSLTTDAANRLQDLINDGAEITNQFSKSAGTQIQRVLEKSLRETGSSVNEIAKIPMVRSLTNLFGAGWLKAILGEVDVEKLQEDITQLQEKYPDESFDELAHRIILKKAIQAAGIGVVTNAIPPIAILLFAVDIAAVTGLQAEMVYEIAGAYQLDLNDPIRRGEVLAMFGLSVGGSSVLKVGLGLLEIIPGIGIVIGASSNAILLYTLGSTASRYYQIKLDEEKA